MSSYDSFSPKKVLIFSSDDDLYDGLARVKIFIDSLENLVVKVQQVRKDGFVLEDLHLVAKYKILSTPCVLIVDEINDTVIFRKNGPDLPSIPKILEIYWEKTFQDKQSSTT